MKIAVVAANGRSGKAFVRLALANGHLIKAGIYGRNPFKQNPNLEIVECDARNYSDIERLTEGCDAIVSLIGHTRKSPKTVQTDAIKNVLKASKSNQHIISLTGTGVRFDGDKPSLLDKFLNFGIKLIDPDRINDGIKHAEVIKQSNRNWTILRVLKLVKGPAGEYILTLTGPAKLFTPRREVARAILQILGSDEYFKKAPVISH